MVEPTRAKTGGVSFVTPLSEEREWVEHNGDLIRCEVVLSPAEEGGYTVVVPSLPGAISEGETEAEAIVNIREALAGVLAEYKAAGQPVPWREVTPQAKPDDIVRWVFVNV